TGVWGPPPGLQTFAWKGLGSLFVYATLCGIGNAVELQRRAARAEVLRAEAQLAALRARLNPHFILNLLHTLMGLVAREPAPPEGAAFARGEGTPQGAGIGLRLIRERLAALYGGAAILETGRSAPGGFRASVTLPYTGPSETPA